MMATDTRKLSEEALVDVCVFDSSQICSGVFPYTAAFTAECSQQSGTRK